MRAITTTGQDDLHVIETAVPEPGPGEVRVAVTAAGVNSFDIAGAQRRASTGWGGSPSPTGPASAGISPGRSTPSGPASNGPAVGTAVAAMLDNFDVPLGAYAEFAIAPAAGVAVLPDRGRPDRRRHRSDQRVDRGPGP